jgi:hypothetical protein
MKAGWSPLKEILQKMKEMSENAFLFSVLHPAFLNLKVFYRIGIICENVAAK